ncbi:MAG: 1-acyl-sn-glycerol-3-phosphate acyltransferase [Cyanobacteria bacterium J06598_1]
MAADSRSTELKASRQSKDPASKDARMKDTQLKENRAQSFYPPEQWPLMTRLVQSISYGLARVLYKVRFSVSDEDVAKVRAVEDARLVFVCNHPTMEDGITLFVLSTRLGQLFHYVVAYESFKGWLGWFIQHLGCYSIRRGLGDRASISQTLSLLKAPRCRLVIFPEGGCSYQNDTIMPFRPGAVQLPMSVLAQLAKKAPSVEEAPDIYLVPLSLKYRYQQPMHRVIEKTLVRLEEGLNISPSGSDTGLDDYPRLRQIAEQVILNIETEANLRSPNAAEEKFDWNQRIERLRQIFIDKCESAAGIEPNVNAPIRERVYRVQAWLEDSDLLEGEAGTKPLLGPNQVTPEAVVWDTIRLLNFDAIYDGYVAQSPTPERFLDTLIRLEREVFHVEHAQPKAARKARFSIGEPINLKDYLADYQRDRTGTVDRLAAQLHQTMQDNLTQLSNRTAP